MTSSLRSASIAPALTGGSPCAQSSSGFNANGNNPNFNLPWRVGD
jgi:hypothetical protein